MNPFARQLLGWQAGNPHLRAAALVLEVKGDFCHDIRQILVEAGRGQDYIELGMDARSQPPFRPPRRPRLLHWCLPFAAKGHPPWRLSTAEPSA